MTRKKAEEQVPKKRLTLKKETLKDLRPTETIRGGFIMKDTVIVRTGH
jgi:hypothetical protein